MDVQLFTTVVLVLVLARRALADQSELLGVTDWANTLGHMLSRSCMYGFRVSGFYSTYDSAKHDRLWHIQCSPINGHGPHECKWTYRYVNRLEETVNFDCEADYYIAGLYSGYDRRTGDRRWTVECCKTPGVRLSTCIGTDWVNQLHGVLEFYLPQNYVIHGIYSYHNHQQKDRQWRFNICDVSTEENIQMRPLAETGEEGGLSFT